MSAERMIDDLLGSSLVPADLQSRTIENPERATVGLPAGVEGYAIPYFDLDGKPVAFYRVRTFDFQPKYKQAKGVGNFIYFPKGFKSLALKEEYVIITEGEKKAACAQKHGFPCIALSGIDSWHNRTFILPEDAEIGLSKTSDKTVIRLTGGDSLPEGSEGLAQGMQEFVDFVVSNKLLVFICFDTDSNGIKFEVQRAAATLGYELRYKGVKLSNIKQLALPQAMAKSGIDDFITYEGKDKFRDLLNQTRERTYAFPRHPNPRDFINKRLQRTKLTRKEAQQTSLALLSELDGSGQRLRSISNDSLYYFHSPSKRLIPASLFRKQSDALTDTIFSRFLYTEYGINQSDLRILQWLTVQFTSEEPVYTIQPHKVFAVASNDDICYQINDGQYIRITGEEKNPWQIVDNGTNGILFEAGKVEELNSKKLIEELEKQKEQDYTSWWVEIFKNVRLRHRGIMTELAPVLFYLSPWLYRWKGSQIPIEMLLGEAGTGKSSLYSLRLRILTGFPSLRNSPDDLRDWHASIASTGGLHVTDNVQYVDKALKQKLSDEMCRLITESDPHIEMRRLYTETDLHRIPISSVFAITAIKQPFSNSDLIQRSVIMELEKESNTDYSSSWPDDQLNKFGGRTAWIAHHVITIHRFLKLVKEQWQYSYKAKHRLVNFEQNCYLMAKAIGLNIENIGQALTHAAAEAISASDWTMEGLVAFARYAKIAGKEKNFFCRDITAWAASQDAYAQCMILNNSRSLGRYIQDHKSMVQTISGITEDGSKNNAACFKIKP